MTDRKACVLRLHEILDRAFCDACKSDEQIARETNVVALDSLKQFDAVRRSYPCNSFQHLLLSPILT